MHTTFEEILAPLDKYLEEQDTQIDKQTNIRFCDGDTDITTAHY